MTCASLRSLQGRDCVICLSLPQSAECTSALHPTQQQQRHCKNSKLPKPEFIVPHPGSFPPAKLPFYIIPLSCLHINIENILREWLFLLSLLFLTHLYWNESQIINPLAERSFSTFLFLFL